MANTVIPGLKPEELAAVAIAVQDASRKASVATRRSRLGRLVDGAYQALTGIRPSNRLADPRLEALRRFVDLSHRSRRVAEHLVPQLLELGFNRPQIEAVAVLRVAGGVWP